MVMTKLYISMYIEWVNRNRNIVLLPTPSYKEFLFLQCSDPHTVKKVNAGVEPTVQWVHICPLYFE